MTFNGLANTDKIFRQSRLVFVFAVLFFFALPQGKAYAFCFDFSTFPPEPLPPCACPLSLQTCGAAWCTAARSLLDPLFDPKRVEINEHTASEFSYHRIWFGAVFLLEQWLPAMYKMTEQLSVTALQQVMIIGTFLDAKQQLETQRLYQTLQARAHKDYHPSEEMCWFGTNVRSVAASEQRGRYNQLALSEVALNRHLGTGETGAARGKGQDLENRWQRFASYHCDEKDNNWQGGDTGLALACPDQLGATGSLAEREQLNRDVNYTRLIDETRTLDVDLSPEEDPFLDPITNDEIDVLSMANNLYGHDVLSRIANAQYLRNEDAQSLYYNLRSVAAKRSVAENSFNAIVGLKSLGPPGMVGPTDLDSDNIADIPGSAGFLAAVLDELGVEDENNDGSNADEIFAMIGERPSYYAQLEILSKRIYQNPDFFVSLYDKPANVARKSVALKAIELMLDRAIFESRTRQEMVMSVLLSTNLEEDFSEVNDRLVAAKVR